MKRLFLSRPARLPVPVLAVAALLLGACSPRETAGPPEASVPNEPPPAGVAVAPREPAAVSLWIHSASLEERNVMREYIHAFNTTQNEVQVDLVVGPAEDRYAEEVLAAFQRGEAPDIVQLNVSELYRHVSQGHLRPLDTLLPEELLADLLPAIVSQGILGGSLYSVALSDMGIGLYVNAARLHGLDVRLPRSLRTAWTADEFDAILAAAFERNGGQPVLDLKLNYGNGWLAHILTPLLASAGAGLCDPETGQADGFVNSEAAVQTLTRIQAWFARGYVDANGDDEAFTSGRTPFSWTGHWDFPRYDRALDGGFAVLPVPDFGNGPRTAHGGWGWSIARSARDPEAAARFLAFMLETSNVMQMTEMTGAVPARRTAVARSSHYGEQLRLEMLARQLEDGFASRPKSARLPEIMAAFQSALDEIVAGAEVRPALDRLAAEIESLAQNEIEPD